MSDSAAAAASASGCRTTDTATSAKPIPPAATHGTVRVVGLKNSCALKWNRDAQLKVPKNSTAHECMIALTCTCAEARTVSHVLGRVLEFLTFTYISAASKDPDGLHSNPLEMTNSKIRVLLI